jgi:hypothetical protein
MVVAVVVVVGGGHAGLRRIRRVEEREKGENEPRRSSWLIFVTHLLGLPLLGPPLVILPIIHPSIENKNRLLSRTSTSPHPSAEGHGGLGGS